MNSHVHNWSDANMIESLDPLVAYDNDSIGREFIPPSKAENDRRSHEERRAKLHVESWKEISSLGDSQRIPKSALKNMCRFETNRAYSQSMVTWCVYLVLTCFAGVLIALIIRNLNI